MAATATVNVRAELAGLRRDLQSAGDLTEGQAQAMVISLEKRLKAAEKAGKAYAKAAKDAKSASKEWEKGLDGVKGSAERLASIVGGPVAEISDLVLDLGEKLSGTAGAIGAVGAGAGVAIAGVAALAVGAKALADAALEARDRLKEQGLAAVIPESAREGLDDYSAASAALQTEVDRLVVELGGSLAPGLTLVTGLATQAARGFREFAASVQESNKQGSVTQQTVSGWMTILAPAPAFIHALAKARMDETAAQRRQIEEWRAAGDAFEEEHQRIFRLANKPVESISKEDAYALLGLTETDEEAAARAAKAARDLAEAKRLAAEAARRQAAAEKVAIAELDELTRAEKATEKHLADLAEQQAMAELYARRWAATEAEAADAARKLDEDLAAFNETLAATTAYFEDFEQRVSIARFAAQAEVAFEAAGQITDAFTAATGRRIEGIQAEMDAERAAIDQWRSNQEEKIDRELEAGLISEREADAARKRLILEERTRKQALQQRTKNERDAAKRAWENTQAAQKAIAIVEGARAVVAALAGSAALGPIAAGIAVAGAVATAAGSIAAIEAAPPPEFPTGRAVPTSQSGSPDHETVRVRPDEGIVNPRATSALGGPAAVDALNRGATMGPTTVVVQLDSRDFARAVVDAEGRARPTPGSWAAGRRPIYGGR